MVVLEVCWNATAYWIPYEPKTVPCLKCNLFLGNYKCRLDMRQTHHFILFFRLFLAVTHSFILLFLQKLAPKQRPEA